MDPEPENRLLPHNIDFSNGNRAIFIKSPSNAEAGDLIKTLKIGKPGALLVLIGGADELDKKLISQLEELFSRGLARAAADTEALIMDGGTAAGVMALMGKAVADRGRETTLLGVAPFGKVTYPGGPPETAQSVPLDPNHSHLVLVEGTEWTSGNEMMFRLASELGRGSTVIAVLVNGGPEAKDEVLRAVRQGWTILVIEGSGRLADEIATLWKKKRKLDDPVMDEIISEGHFVSFPLSGESANLRREVVCRLESPLADAWRRFTQYDYKAISEQRSASRWLKGTLLLGVMSTLVALLEKQLTGKQVPPLLMNFLYYMVIGAPIVVSVLINLSNRLKQDKKWILLRASAEEIKKEIFRYRGRTGDYSDKQIKASKGQVSRGQVLVKKMEGISRELMKSEVNASSLPPLQWPCPPISGPDDGFSLLTPDRYIEIRLTDQLNYYSSKTATLDTELRALQVFILSIGGLGTILATAGYRIWIALTTAVVTALTAYVGQLQMERMLIKYNQAAAELINRRAWWDALPAEEKVKQDNKEILVESCEKILETERRAWLRREGGSTVEQGRPSDKGKRKKVDH